MAEIRKFGGSVEALEKAVSELSALSKSGEAPGDETRAKFTEAEKQLSELQPATEKMRKRCEARESLEAVKAQLFEQLPGSPENVLQAARQLLNPPMEDDTTGDVAMEKEEKEPVPELAPEKADAIRALLERAEELEGLATYGVKMAEKVSDLLVRFDATLKLFNSEVVPHFGAAVAAASQEDAERRAEAEREAAAQAEEEKRLAAEERMRLAQKLTEDSDRMLQAQREAEEAEKRKLEQEAEAKREADAAIAAEEEAFQRAQKAEEQRIAEVGPEQACAEALVTMLSMPVGKYREAVDALHNMIAGVAKEPEDARMRIIRIANDGFQKQLGRQPGCWFFLRGVGFQPKTREGLPPGLLASLGMGGGLPSERFLWLQEPNMMAEYEAWVLWHSRIKVVADFLHALERLAFQRTAHLGRHGLDALAQTAVSVGEVTKLWEAHKGS